MAIEVGTAYISILPSTSRLAPAIRKELGLIGKTSEEQGKKTGRRFGASMAAAAKVGTLALAAGIGAVVKSSVDLEAKFSQTMNVIGATTNAPAKKMKELQQLALDLGASTSFSASEASEAMLELAKAGLTPATIQAGALEGTLQLAAAGGTSLASAATIASNAMNTFNLEGNEMGKISAALAGGANASTASVESLGQALGQVGPGAKNAGLDLNETVGALAAFDNAGIKGSDAGTSLKTMLARLVPQTQKAATAMKKANLDFTNADGSFVSLTEISAQLQKGLSGLSESARTTALNDIFGSDSSRAAAVLMEEGAAGIQKYIKATKDASAAQKAADARTSGTAGALERLGGAWETVRLRIGLAMGPAVVRAADLMAVVLDKVGDGVVIAANKIPALVAGFRDLSVWVKTNSQWLGPLVVGLTAFAAVVGIAPKVFLLVRAIRLFSMATTLATVAQWRMNAALLANPFVLIIAAVVALVAGLVWFFTQTKLGQKIVSVAWNGIKTAVGAVVDWFQGTVVPILAAVWDGIKAGAMGVWTAMQSVWEFMKSVWAGIVIAAKVAWTVLKVIFVALATAFILMWKWIKTVWSVTGAPIFAAIGAAASAVWNWLRDKVFKPMKLGFQLMALGFVLAYRRYILPAWNGIKTAATAVWNWVKTKVIAPFKRGLQLWGAVFRVLWKTYVIPAFNGIKAIMSSVWAWIKANVIDRFMNGLRAIGRVFSWLWKNAIVPAWNGIKSAGSAAWKWIQSSVFTPFKKGVSAIGEAFKAVKKVIKAAWDGIKKAAAAPVNFVIDTVYNKGIKSTWNKVADAVGLDLKLPTMKRIGGYATGGVLPGYTPGRDVHEFYSPSGGRLSLSGGEAIMRPEFTRAVGGARGVAALNARARKGQAFKNGGVFGGVSSFFGDAWDKIKDVSSSFLSGPASLIKKTITGPMNNLLGGMGGGQVGKVAAQLPKKVVGSLVTKAKDFASSMFGGSMAGGGKPSGNGLGGWQNMWNIVKNAFPSATLNSAYRPGAITAVGTPSMHGLGRAIDVTPSMAIFNWLSKNFPNSNELIFSPANGRQIYKGRRMSFGEPTRGDHWDHIHWSMFNGGVIPKLYDQGGILPHNGMAVNKSGKPEGILTNAESRALKAGGSIRNATPKGDGGPRVQERRVSMRIENWRDGTGYMTEIADDAISANAGFDKTTRRMR